MGCSGPSADSTVLSAEMPLHLEDHLDAAVIEGSEPPDISASEDAAEWLFAEAQPGWRPARPTDPRWEPVGPVQTDGALRLPLNQRHRVVGQRLHGAIYVELPDWNIEDWSHVEIRARASEAMRNVGLAFNRDPTREPLGFFTDGSRTPVVSDGTPQTYRLPLESPAMTRWEGPWTHLAIWFESDGGADDGTIDLLSVRLIRRGAEFSTERAGATAGNLGSAYTPVRRVLFMHAPASIAYRVRIPENARLDVGLGVLSPSVPVTFAVTVAGVAEVTDTLWREQRADRTEWAERTVDLAAFAGQTVTLALEAQATQPGTVALWASPTLTGPRATDRPNVIFYVIDGAGADYMSAYGYNRHTTPNIERIAAEGAVFEHAYSNAPWTRPSTASFMTSLQHSVLGGFRSGFNVVPENATTMAQHFHRAGYQTAVFTANPNAGRMSGLDREVDFFREDWEEFSYLGERGNYRESSRFLHDAFWRWREEYAGEPYWVHFQTTDIHEDFPAVSPFSGLFVSPQELDTWRDWSERLEPVGGHSVYGEGFERTGVSRVEFFTLHQGLYDETMAHNDYQLGRLVDRLKAVGEWENTLLVIGADHSADAGMDDMNVALQDSLPPRWSYPMFRPSVGRVPLIFVWPGHITAGQRIHGPVVSMIDVLPTILDLVGLPLPEVMQGQSLAPVLLGQGEWEPRPVIFEQHNADGLIPDEFSHIDMVDGRWGASLEISPSPEPPPGALRPVPLLVYDLRNDPYALYSIHDERPDLVEKYTRLLETQWDAHQSLAQLFTPAADVVLTPEQLETLRSLGYIR
jgi:arylsulfatase A-like enzyme